MNRRQPNSGQISANCFQPVRQKTVEFRQSSPTRKQKITTTTKPQKNNNKPLQVQSYLFIKILITTTTNQQYVNLPKQLLEFKKQLNSYMLPFSSLGHWRVRFSWSIQTYVLLVRLRDLFGLIIISKLYRHLIH